MHEGDNALEKSAMLPEFSPKCNFVALTAGSSASALQLRAATVVA